MTEKSMKVMKPSILYFSPCGLGEGVGGGARLGNMMGVLGQLETNVQVISYRPADKFGVTHKQVNNCLNTTIVSVRRSSPKILKLFALKLIFIYGLKHIGKSNIIFAHAPTVVSGFPAFILSKVFNKPFAIDHMDIKDPDTPGFIYNYVLKNADIVFAISRYLEEEVRDMGNLNAVYLPIFLDVEVFKKDVLARVQIREKLGIDDKEVVIGYAGSFSHIEGLPVLLRVFKNLSSKYGNIKLIVVGGSNVAGSDDVEKLIDELNLKERVILVPTQPYELMPKYLSAFDIASSPKIDCDENRAANPIKIYEYMSMGLPMVVSAVGEPSNVIQNGYDGFLVKPEDEYDLERTLEYVIQNLDSAKAVGERAREKIVKNYTQQLMQKRIEEALERLSSKTA
ncbi:glycosyltransferase family 4 protein [Chloroflexota bacterium]